MAALEPAGEMRVASDVLRNALTVPPKEDLAVDDATRAWRNVPSQSVPCPAIECSRFAAGKPYGWPSAEARLRSSGLNSLQRCWFVVASSACPGFRPSASHPRRGRPSPDCASAVERLKFDRQPRLRWVRRKDLPADCRVGFDPAILLRMRGAVLPEP
jgi:hypothetical protein